MLFLQNLVELVRYPRIQHQFLFQRREVQFLLRLRFDNVVDLRLLHQAEVTVLPTLLVHFEVWLVQLIIIIVALKVIVEVLLRLVCVFWSSCRLQI